MIEFHIRVPVVHDGKRTMAYLDPEGRPCLKESDAILLKFRTPRIVDDIAILRKCEEIAAPLAPELKNQGEAWANLTMYAHGIYRAIRRGLGAHLGLPEDDETWDAMANERFDKAYRELQRRFADIHSPGRGDVSDMDPEAVKTFARLQRMYEGVNGQIAMIEEAARWYVTGDQNPPGWRVLDECPAWERYATYVLGAYRMATRAATEVFTMPSDR